MVQKIIKAPESTTRRKLILSGLYLSRFDSPGLRNLGFESFTEAFNVIGYALGARPASIKNYRDEFDPFFPNERRGWHKRPMRQYCREILEEYGNLGLDDFTGLVRSFFGLEGNEATLMAASEDPIDGASAFAKRLVTGLAAERYFESVHAGLPAFQGLLMENTTSFGCGYDFRLRKEPRRQDFLAVEVKGLSEQSGTVVMTPKEYAAAAALTDRFFLFVVKNFRETPYHTMFQNPLSSDLQFTKTERGIVQTSWLTAV
jgi:Domain of unknown function (DUF3883)